MSATTALTSKTESEGESLDVLESKIRQSLEEVDGNELRIGQLLKTVKVSEPHGGFGKWLERTKLPASRRAISNYMCLADFVAWREQRAPGEQRWPNYIAYALGPHIHDHGADVHDILNVLKRRDDFNPQVLRGLINRKIKKEDTQNQKVETNLVSLLAFLEADVLKNTPIAIAGIYFFDQLSKKLSQKSAEFLSPSAESFLRAIIDFAQSETRVNQPTRPCQTPGLKATNAGSTAIVKSSAHEEVSCGISN